MPKMERRNQLLSPLTIDKEQQVSDGHDDIPNTQITNDEHKQIASYTNQLAYLTDKQQFKPTPSRSRRAGYNHQRAQKKMIISKLEGENR